MTYTLHRLAPGAYDLVLDGAIIGSVVEVVHPGKRSRGWFVELLDDRANAQRPAPFVAVERTFPSLSVPRVWLGHARIVRDRGRR